MLRAMEIYGDNNSNIFPTSIWIHIYVRRSACVNADSIICWHQIKHMVTAIRIYFEYVFDLNLFDINLNS